MGGTDVLRVGERQPGLQAGAVAGRGGRARAGDVDGADAVSNETPEQPGGSYVFGVDLDGVVADFYAGIRPIAAEWLGKRVDELTPCPSYGLTEWGFGEDKREYNKLHRFAVEERDLFTRVEPIQQAPQVLRRLSAIKEIRIRIITHRLFVSYAHVASVQQTVSWLDHHGIPYWDLCFMKDKSAVGADLYIEDAPHNIEELRRDPNNSPVIVFSNSTNRKCDEPRADNWDQVEELVINKYLPEWQKKHG